MSYTKVKVHVSESQKQKIKKGLQAGTPVSIRLVYADLIGDGEDVLALTKSQVKQLEKAYQSGGGTTIKMSKTQLQYNMSIEGGFLAALASLAARFLPTIAKTVLPALGIGALSGLASSGVQKAMGNGLFLKKGGCVCQLETDGKGVYLGPVTGDGLKYAGDGLYLKKEGQLYDRKGILLGANSPFKTIPILGMIL